MEKQNKLIRVVFSIALIAGAWIMSALGRATLFTVTAGAFLVIGVVLLISTVKALVKDHMK